MEKTGGRISPISLEDLLSDPPHDRQKFCFKNINSACVSNRSMQQNVIF